MNKICVCFAIFSEFFTLLQPTAFAADDSGSDTESSNSIESVSTISTGDTLMVRRGNICYFNYTLKGGDADFTTTVGEATDTILVGDWDGDGEDTICLRRGNTCIFIDDITTKHVYLTVS